MDQSLADGLPELRQNLGATLLNLESLSGRLDAIVGSNQEALSHLGGTGMREVAGSLEDLRRLVRDLSNVASQLERNPSQFLFGGEQPEEYPTE